MSSALPLSVTIFTSPSMSSARPATLGLKSAASVPMLTTPFASSLCPPMNAGPVDASVPSYSLSPFNVVFDLSSLGSSGPM